MSMQSRRDLFQAHRLMTQRAALALLRGEPDVPDQPLRRINVATFSGVMVAIIAVAGFAIWGLLFHGSAPLTYTPGTLIMDKQTGVNYVFCGPKNKELCAVANYPSALLALHGLTGTESVNQSELTGYQHGPTIGIAGLPQDLPNSGLLVKQPWESCTQQVTVTGQGQETLTTVGAGIQTGGQPLGNQAMLVSSAGNNYVIWDGERMLIRQRTQTALFPDDSVSSVPLVWLSSIKQGAPFQAPVVDGSGTPVNGPNGLAKAGQVYEETSTGDFFVLTANGKLAPINSLQSLMLLVLSGQKQATSVGESAVGNDTTSPLQSPGLPRTKPSVLPSPSGAFCAVWSGSGPALTMQVETGGSLPSPSTATGASSTSGLATNVAIPPAKGALVQETGDNISYFLVTGGFRYAIQSQTVLGYLGYLPSEAVQVPGSVLDLIPKGPGLYPVNASNPVPAG